MSKELDEVNENNINNNRDLELLEEVLGQDNLQKVMKINSDILQYLIKTNRMADFISYCKNNNIFKDLKPDNLDEKVITAFNKYFEKNNKLTTIKDLMNYNPSLFSLIEDQQRIFNLFGVNNIKKFQEETGFFTYRIKEYSSELEMLHAFEAFFKTGQEKVKNINFKNGNLTYEEFKDVFAKCLDIMRMNNVFRDFPDYDWLDGDFRKEHSEIFIDKEAPENLRRAFYKNKIDPELIREHKEYIPFLLPKKLSNVIKANMKLIIPSIENKDKYSSINFINEYTSRYGNNSFLEFCAKYGQMLTNLEITSLKNEIDSKEKIEKLIRDTIYENIKDGYFSYEFLMNVEEFTSEHPEIFIDLNNLTSIPEDEKQRLTLSFYRRELNFEDIKKYEELATYLKNKDLTIGFGLQKRIDYITNRRRIRTFDYSLEITQEYSDLELLEVFGQERFLYLCKTYGRYMEGVGQSLHSILDIIDGYYVDKKSKEKLNFTDITLKIEDYITNEIYNGNLNYTLEDAPDFLKISHPDIFLSQDAPLELKRYFYNYSNNYGMTFEVLQKNRDWLPYLKGKDIKLSLTRPYVNRNITNQYFNEFGENAIKLGINRGETVTHMINTSKVNLMKEWYNKTGQKFIPDFVVMENFSIEEADKFLLSGYNWNSLMKIKSFANFPKGREAMLKLAYIFGAFDQDQSGFKKLQTILTEIPRNINPEYSHIVDNLKRMINNPTKEGNEENYFLELKETLEKEGIKVDNNIENLISVFYRENKDKSYSLIINQESYPKSCAIIRQIFEKFPDSPVITPEQASRYFGNFALKYDKDFKEFFIKNLDTILHSHNPNNIINIQKRFEEIKAFYKNIALTWDVACAYVETNRFSGINPGNEIMAATISKVIDYTQEDFNILQQIYNYGKQRTFSSIPRIENTIGNYSYEILRLSDPLAIAIGNLTDCCQKLNDIAELCMEHSVVDTNGRIFVVRDKDGSIVAQSWVWRNKNVLCFDNIEVSNRQMIAHGIPKNKSESSIRNKFTDEILEVYKKAAADLIKEDEKVYSELLSAGKITEEQYDGLKLEKVTAGLGFSNIKGSLETLKKDHAISRPLPFKEKVKLKQQLYTIDSNTQYILEERKNQSNYKGPNLFIHSDTYIEYTDDNFGKEELNTFKRLESITKNKPAYLETQNYCYGDTEHIVSELAYNYGLNKETTRIIMNPNFAIIYDQTKDKVLIGDLLFNTTIDNGRQQMDIEKIVTIQIRQALNQIGENKEIDISYLNQNQQAMYNKAMGLNEEIDIERGVHLAG